MKDIKETKEKVSKKLLNKSGISGVGVGKKLVDGIPTEEDSIIIFVAKKKDKDEVTKHGYDGYFIPEEINGIPTDVVEVGDIKLQLGFREKVRPVKPGYSVSHINVSAGTIGGFFRDRDGDIVALSNFHVLTEDGKSRIGDLIYQPGTADAKRNSLRSNGWVPPYSSHPYIGTLKKFNKLSSRGTHTHDSAIAKVYPELYDSGLVDLEYPEVNKKLRGFRRANIGDIVYKCGRTTGFTSGRVIATDAEFSIDYAFGPVKFKNLILTNAMSQGGDSGSAIFDGDMNMVGLLFAGSSKVTLHNNITDIVDHYGLNIIDNTNYSDFTWKGYGWKNNTTDGLIKQDNGNVVIEDNANHHCYIETMMTGNINSVQATINTGSDKGSTWGIGLGLVFQRGNMRINVRHGGTYGSYFNSNYNLGFGIHRPHEDYKITFTKNRTHWFGDIEDSSKNKIRLMQIDRSMVGDNPLYVRIGKMGLEGGPTDHAKPGDVNAGEIGLCKILDFTAK
jgi:hypothetical protein